ncbi:serine protease, partial [Staphylococcus caprae]
SEDNALNHVSKQQPEEVSPTSDIAKDDVEVASTTNETNGYLKTNEISNDSDIDVNASTNKDRLHDDYFYSEEAQQSRVNQYIEEDNSD